VSATELFDRGLQPERTLLAWRRTCLALATAMAVAIKLLALESDVATLLLAVFGLAVPAVAWLLAAHRYRRSQQRLTRTGRDPELPAGGPAIAVATLAAVLFGVLALVLVLA
jgi:uncharacterized membrane protein YidH (DUF202 family)